MSRTPLTREELVHVAPGDRWLPVVKDATASYSDTEMRAALEVNIPNYATAIITADEVAEAMYRTFR